MPFLWTSPQLSLSIVTVTIITTQTDSRYSHLLFARTYMNLSTCYSSAEQGICEGGKRIFGTNIMGWMMGCKADHRGMVMLISIC